MLKLIRDAVQRRKLEKEKIRLDKIFTKNRQRFDSIHSDNRYPTLNFIYQRLHSNDNTLTDSEIIRSYNEFSNAIQTNTFASAELELVSISTICYFRPHLTEELLKEGLKMILWSVGDGIDYSILKQFINLRILNPELEPYGGLPDKEGIEWLSKIVNSQTDLIKKLLSEVIEQNNKELNGM